MNQQGKVSCKNKEYNRMPRTCTCCDGRTPCSSNLQVKALDPQLEEHLLKVRKPYTITKQREKWTDEEHDKFLEALKLYGRAWRSIEGHIGTKTSVQIRSHAQKFFTKVVRQSSTNSDSTLKAIEIPPPRPKRKPEHPYPRKLVIQPGKGASVIEEAALSSSPSQSVSRQENTSPASVLSPFALDTIKSSMQKQSKSCGTPSSSTFGSSPLGTPFDLDPLGTPFDLDIGLRSPTGSAGTSTLSGQSTGLTMQNDSLMASDKFPEDDFSSKCSSQQPTCLKLFGKTVMVSDPKQMPYSATSQDSDVTKSQASRGSRYHVKDHFASSSKTSSWTTAQLMYYIPIPTNRVTSEEASASLWPYYQVAMCTTITHPEKLVREDFIQSGAVSLNQKQQKESTPNGSIVESSAKGTKADGGALSKSFAAQSVGKIHPVCRFQPSENSAFRVLKVSADQSTRSFLPYKRCLADGGQSSMMLNGDVDSKGVQFCL